MALWWYPEGAGLIGFRLLSDGGLLLLGGPCTVFNGIVAHPGLALVSGTMSDDEATSGSGPEPPFPEIR